MENSTQLSKTKLKELEEKGIYSIQPNYAVVYRAKSESSDEISRLTRETGLTFKQAQKRAIDTHGEVHKMNGVKSRRVSQH